MNIGFVTMFAFRPHVEHMYYLATQMKKGGHQNYFLNCFASLDSCYNLQAKKGTKLVECAKCIAGSLYTYTNENVTAITPSLSAHLPESRLFEMSRSSAYTLTRIEDPRDINRNDVLQLQKNLHKPINVVYENARRWIVEKKLDYLLVFNGRMDVTRAIIDACADLGVKFACVERTWFGHGVEIFPGVNCLSLRHLHQLATFYRDKPLTENQAIHAASLIVSRFKKKNVLEWRAYNLSSEEIEWPIKETNLKVLFLPSSKNEQLSQEDWKNSWDDYTEIFEKITQRLGIPFESIVVRGHPNWGERISGIKGEDIGKYYLEWCSKKNIRYIKSSEPASTSALIKQADLVVLNGSSAAYEAGLLGKTIICLGKCAYQFGNIAHFIIEKEDIERISWETLRGQTPEDTIRNTLRYIYVRAHRYALFARQIRAITTTKYVYSENFDSERLLSMLEQQTLIPDDQAYAVNGEEELRIVNLLLNHDYDSFIDDPMKVDTRDAYHGIIRRPAFRWVDKFRERSLRGDLK